MHVLSNVEGRRPYGDVMYNTAAGANSCRIPMYRDTPTIRACPGGLPHLRARTDAFTD